MTKERLATVSASVGAGLLFATAALHQSAYGDIVSQAPADIRPLVAAVWLAVGISLVLAALLAITATPLFIVRRRALLAIAALTPLAIAVLQIAFLGFIPPTALLLVDSAVLFAAGELGRAHQQRPVTG